jgi:tRNA threonylcarbamoyladenosine biosynthesis protein TsaB
LRPEPCVLAFDTSAAHCAAALLSGDQVLVERQEDMAKGQAERLMPMLEEMLAEAGIGWRDLAVLGVGVGPGNFTGVRIAVAAARGLALGLGIPAVGVTTFEAMALGAARPCAVVLDARRGQVYVQVFGAQAGAAMLVGAGAPLPLTAGTGFLGHDAEASALRHGGQAARPVHSLTGAMARIALARRADPDLMRPAPFYLRGAEAAPPSDPPPVILP